MYVQRLWSCVFPDIPQRGAAPPSSPKGKLLYMRERLIRPLTWLAEGTCDVWPSLLDSDAPSQLPGWPRGERDDNGFIWSRLPSFRHSCLSEELVIRLLPEMLFNSRSSSRTDRFRQTDIRFWWTRHVQFQKGNPQCRQHGDQSRCKSGSFGHAFLFMWLRSGWISVLLLRWRK